MPETVELTPEEARFLLNCVSFSRDAGVLRAVPDSSRLSFRVAEKLAPIANGVG